MSSTWITQHLQDDANAPSRTRGSAAQRAAVDDVMQIQWTDERPTDPGKYWLSFPPAERKRWAPSAVKTATVVQGLDALHVSWDDEDGHYRLLPLAGHQFDGALWAERTTPEDPFAKPSEMLGGISGKYRRLISGDDAYSRFEQTIARLFRDDIKSGAMNGSELWSALANVTWFHGDSEVGYSFRAAGDLIAALVEAGDYMDFWRIRICVSDRISDAMSKEGWTYEECE